MSDVSFGDRTRLPVSATEADAVDAPARAARGRVCDVSALSVRIRVIREKRELDEKTDFERIRETIRSPIWTEDPWPAMTCL